MPKKSINQIKFVDTTKLRSITNQLKDSIANLRKDTIDLLEAASIKGDVAKNVTTKIDDVLSCLESLEVSSHKLDASSHKLNNCYKEIINLALQVDPSTHIEFDQKGVSYAINKLDQESEAIQALKEHFEKLLKDKRLLATPHNHQIIAEFFKNLFNQHIGQLGNVVSSIKAKKIAGEGGIGKVKKYKYPQQQEACRSYYLEHKNEYKNKTDAAYAIEGKTIGDVKITVSPRTIEKYLTGL